MSTPAALPGLTGQDAADLLIGDVARLAVIDWKIAAYQARRGRRRAATATQVGRERRGTCQSWTF
jgi:hypothetical protein